VAQPAPGNVAGPPLVLVERPAPQVARLVLNNPARRGALSPELLRQLIAELGRLDAGCVILTGRGEFFSSGYDLDAIGDPLDPDAADRMIAPKRVAALDAIANHPAPVLAALNGPAIGGGLELALACDLRIAVSAAELAAPAGRLGLVYTEEGLARVLAGIPPTVAAELFLLGTPLSAERAHALGVINRMVEPAELESAALAAALRAAAFAPLAQSANVRVLRALRSARAPLPDAQRERLAALRREGMRSRDFAEGIEAFRRRREPVWRGS
jgi:enoyl-CoA hydratase/carnithine racemase